jgi:hypothetical protein
MTAATLSYLIISASLTAACRCHAFQIVPPSSTFFAPCQTKLDSRRSSCIKASFLDSIFKSSAPKEQTSQNVEELKNAVEELTSATDRGRSKSTTTEEASEIEDALLKLEAACTDPQPARNPLVEGMWEVLYTTCPPPSNGMLGPFKGTAYQDVDLEGINYQNILRVPPNDWLTATLDATWQEWDGTVVKDVKKDTQTSPDPLQENSFGIDWGATCWKVLFQKITIRLFGIPLLKQTFPPETARIWRTTYIDGNTRIVRAGRTGRQGDETVFYMVRSENK